MYNPISIKMFKDCNIDNNNLWQLTVASIKEIKGRYVFLDTTFKSFIDTKNNNKVYVLYYGNFVCVGRGFSSYVEVSPLAKLRGKIRHSNEYRKSLHDEVLKLKCQ